MIFLVSSRKVVFLFSESMMLFFRRKIKDDLSQKLHVSMMFSSNVLKRWSFQKIALEYDLSCIIRKDGICFSRKYDIFSMAENERWSISKNTWKYDVFCILDKDGIAFSYKLWNYASAKKAQMIFSQKIHLNDISSVTEKNDTHPRKDDIGILGWHPRKGSNDPLYFYGGLFRCFHILLSDVKTRRLNI